MDIFLALNRRYSEEDSAEKPWRNSAWWYVTIVINECEQIQGCDIWAHTQDIRWVLLGKPTKKHTQTSSSFSFFFCR